MSASPHSRGFWPASSQVTIAYMHVSEIDTPALIVDLDIFERNLQRVAGYARDHGLRLRPHTKTHKSVRVGARQLQAGAIGLTVAKVGEAEVMLGAQPPDMLVAFPVIGRAKLERLAEVARKTRVTVALDSVAAARQLSDAACAAHVDIGVLAEVDVGLGRVCVSPRQPLLHHISTRLLHRAVWRRPNSLRGSLNPAPRPDHHRWRIQAIPLGPPLEFRRGDFRPRCGSPRRPLPQDE